MAQSGMSVPTYSYAASNPLRYVDPSGLATLVLYASNMWDNALITNSNRGAFEAGLQQDLFNSRMTGELTKETIIVNQLDYVSKGSYALDPWGNSWDQVIVMGHGTQSMMWGSPTDVFDGDDMGGWFEGWGGPRSFTILGCEAGGQEAPFRKQLKKKLPMTLISGKSGPRRLDFVRVNGVPRVQAWW
jgi:hypothetical protein